MLVSNKKGIGRRIVPKLALRKHFPWRIFSHLILIQAATVLGLYLISGLIIRHYFRVRLEKILSPEETLHILTRFDAGLVLFMSAVFVLLSFFALLLAKRLVFPIGRMILKTKSVLQPEIQLTDKDKAFENLDEKSFGEWSDLESSIEDIRRDLETKIESLRTEREEQATLMGAISDAILAVDLDQAPLFYNSRFELLFGNQNLSQNLSQNLRKKMRLWEIFRVPEILEPFQKALKEGKGHTVKAFPIDQPEGRRFFSISVSPLRNSREALYGAVGIFHDVTDLKRTEQIRIDFVANVSHELRTPLTAIKGYADTLKADTQAGRPLTPEFLEILVRNSDRLMNLINDLLDLSSLESTDILQKSYLSTADTTARVVQQMRGAFDTKNQKIHFHSTTETVLADPKRLEQVLVNLLDNANKYTPEDGRINISWDLSEDQKETLLKIRDSGPGIPVEHQPRLFERFYRVDKARSREKGGTGLGLAIVKHILQRHEGSVVVESAPGQGSTFVCRFPA